jgi:hypothetical protein
MKRVVLVPNPQTHRMDFYEAPSRLVIGLRIVAELVVFLVLLFVVPALLFVLAS